MRRCTRVGSSGGGRKRASNPGDVSLRRYGIEFTGTAPDWRGQGLATLAKLAARELAARAGIRWVGTANDRDNAPMLAVNRRLGSRAIPDLNIYEREIDPEPPQ